MQSYYVGLDGGGTKTAAVIIDTDGNELGRGTGGPGNIAQHDDAVLADSVRTATLEACTAAGIDATSALFAGVCAGMAGYSAEKRRRAFAALLQTTIPAVAYRLEPDYVIAYWGATYGEPGIVIIAGTGAVAYGRNARGEDWREDGLGYLLGDRGSGFNLGLRALRYTLAEMNEGRSDALTQAVLAHTGGHTQNEVVQWLYSGFQPARVAALAPAIGALAEAGEPIARTQVALMARQLRYTVRQLRYKLWMPRESAVYPLGGLWNLGPFFRSEFADPQWLHIDDAQEGEVAHGGRFTIATPRSDPAYGAALLAR